MCHQIQYLNLNSFIVLCKAFSFVGIYRCFSFIEIIEVFSSGNESNITGGAE